MKARPAQSVVTPSPHTQRNAQDEAVAGYTDRSQSQTLDFRSGCLRRDSYRYIITDVVDFEHWDENEGPYSAKVANAEVAHIIIFSFGSWKSITVRKPFISLRLTLVTHLCAMST